MTSRAAHSSKRPSVAAAPPELIAKPSCRIHSLAIVADRAQLTGTHTVELGENTVLHPYCKINAEHGDVTIGKKSIVNEAAVVGILEGEGEVVIGDGVTIGSSAIVEAKHVGDGTTIEVRVKIGKGAIIGRHCKIAPLSVVRPDEYLPDFTVVYGDNRRRHDQMLAENPEAMEAKHKVQKMHSGDLLPKLIPDSSAKWQ